MNLSSLRVIDEKFVGEFMQRPSDRSNPVLHKLQLKPEPVRQFLPLKQEFRLPDEQDLQSPGK